MSNDKEILKELYKKKSLIDLEAMIVEQKRKMHNEKDLMKLSHMSMELGVMQEVRDQKERDGHHVHKPAAKPGGKPELKSYDDYVKSKK
ncbi:MAG: hypothetical protein FWG77_06100 [Treponema sp.]|nr:hypothetical protein [Treponema sp.]